MLFRSEALLAEDVANIATDAMLIMADGLSRSLGLGDFGMAFEVTEVPNPVFPLASRAGNALSEARRAASFSHIAPFMVEVFDQEVLACANDLSKLYVLSLQLLALPAPAPSLAPASAPLSAEEASAVRDFDGLM